LFVCLFGWLVGWLVGRLVGCLVGLLFGGFVDWLVLVTQTKTFMRYVHIQYTKKLIGSSLLNFHDVSL
jgi:hypothetical protein